MPRDVSRERGSVLQVAFFHYLADHDVAEEGDDQ